MRMKNPPHPGQSVRYDCLEPVHGEFLTTAAKALLSPRLHTILFFYTMRFKREFLGRTQSYSEDFRSFGNGACG